jgi:uncharacterized protein YqjF (DUF2071 family)
MPATLVAQPPAEQAFAWPVRRPLLSAEWRNLVLLNYEVDPAVLAPHVPAGTELDFHEGKTYLSIVGFQFQSTRLCGLRIPGHANFEEVNLRFYVRRRAEEGWRRGVTFIRELAPRRAVALTARWLYNENYLCVPMRHHIDAREPSGPLPLEGMGPNEHGRPEVARAQCGSLCAATGEGGRAGTRLKPNFDAPIPTRIEYYWKFHRHWRHIALEPTTPAALPEPHSHDEFIIEHYWGYSALPRRAKEYLVAHPPWRIAAAQSAELNCDVAALYGQQFAPFLQAEPTSAFWADGSQVRVYPGQRIT